MVAGRPGADESGVHLRLRRLLAGTGVACLVASAVCFASEGALLAAPFLAVNLHLPASLLAVVEPSPGPSPTPAPSPSPSPSVAPHPVRHSFLGEGPIVFSGSGTYQLGVNKQTRDGLDLGYDSYSTALTLTADRRTAQTSLEISDSLGVGGGAFNSGSFIVAYRTPTYTLSYGQLAGPADTQLEIGGFARGISLTLPLRNGDLTYMSAIATDSEEETYRIYGLRRDWNALGGYFALSGYYGTGQQGGRESIGDFSFQKYGPVLSTQTELAIGQTDDVLDQPNGIRVAGGFQADIQGKGASETFGIRYDPAGFNTLTGVLDGGMSVDLALRRQGGFGNFSLDYTHLDDRNVDTLSHDDDVTLTGGKSWGHFGLEYVGSFQDEREPGSITLNRSAGLTATEQIKKISIYATVQKASTSATDGNAATSQYALGISRNILGGAASYQFTRSLENGGGLSNGTSVDQTVDYARPFGKKADIQVSEGFEDERNNLIPARIVETAVSVVRRLSSVVSIQASADVFHQTGPGGGSGTGFSLSLVGPFGFNQPQSVQGKANPHLPAVIRGTVTMSSSASPFSYNVAAPRGLNNAMVVLDDGITERTDSAGNFEFRFVPQGTHVVRIDPATISPGLVLDREFQTVNVLGGQTTTLAFNVGNFGAVSGQVYARGPNGTKIPIPKVGIAVDGVQATVTTPQGFYQVGRLNPGAHTIEVVTATVPSTIAFVDDTKKTITVAAGSQVPLDFAGSALGSIAGFVYTAGEGGFGNQVGANNVYVVAEPGEHAGITNDDGSFLLDNLPPGSYTLSIDQDTIPDGLGVVSGPDGPIDLAGGANVSGVVFRLGGVAKNVVFTFNQGKEQAIQVETEPAVVPPGALVHVVAHTNAKDVTLTVQSDVFGNFPLHLDKKSGAWVGDVIAPTLTRGDYSLTVAAQRKDVRENTVLVQVDPGLSLFTIRVFPAKPLPGHQIKVSIKTYAPVAAGDVIEFQDGFKLPLPKPNGRLFVFSMPLWEKGLPYSATIRTKRGQNYPISLR